MMTEDFTPTIKKFTIQNKLGLHARPVAMFVKCANRFEADITVEKNSEAVNGKSIMGMMMLAAGKGSEITIISVGPDSKEALQEIEKLINDKFGEE
ncbi:MAG: HPr family phosphocarrier protein [Candidatus Aureabacteria bacterium]|nr:HPr family phosphocarrier protein [Candidatus Auribacterota bacterium]